MGDIRKNVLKDDLEEANRKYKDSPAILGKGMLTFPSYNNSMRTNMFSSHLNQFKDMVNPEFPFFFSNCENIVGKYSDGYKKMKSDCEVIAKVCKFEDLLDAPKIYKLFIFDRGKNRYDVIERKPGENLTEVFGYDYNNETIDSYDVGDLIPEGTTVYKSKSYDEFGNYGYGINAKVMFTTDPATSEDATAISRSFANRTITTEYDSVSISLNNNDYPLNIYGDDLEYKVFPNIGEKTNGIVLATRRLQNEQVLYDFRTDRLSHISDGDTVYYCDGEIVDIDIYCNNDELEDNTFNRQILDYLDSQTKYYQEIYDICKEIEESGHDYSPDLDYLYKRSKEFIDKDMVWKNNDNDFSNLLINVTLRREVPLAKGSKITGRYGNKSVVSEIREDEDMPYDEDGPVDVLLSLLAFINRTIASPLFEVSTNFITETARKRMRDMKTYKEKEKLLFEVISMFNKKQEEKMRATYNGLSKKEKEDYIDDAIEHGIYIHLPSVGEDYPFFYKLCEIYEKYEWLTPKDIYVNKWGRKIKCLQKQYIGKMYVMALKQTSKKGFSVRGMGAINSKGLPERSYKNKSHTELYSTSNIRFGEFESLNFLIGMTPEELTLLHAIYRTSLEARKDLGKHILKPDVTFKMDKKYVSRVAEIFDVYLKSLGLEIDVVDEQNELVPLNDEYLTDYTPDDKTYLCTEFQKFLYERLKSVEEEVQREHPVEDIYTIAQMVDDRMKHSNYVMSSEHYEDRIDIFKETDDILKVLPDSNQ